MVDLVGNIVKAKSNNPKSLAVVDRKSSINYEDLLGLALRYTHTVSNIEKHSRVAIVLPQSIDAYASMMGVLMAGGYYCPINISLPVYRKKQILDIFSPDLIICSEEELEGLELANTNKVITPKTLTNKTGKISEDHHELAYVIFTSGSTGIPKGVMIRRDAISHFLNWSIEEYHVTKGDIWGQFSNLGFDLSVVDIFTCLGGGGTLVPISSPKDRLMPAMAIRDFQITIWHSVPSVIDFINKAKQLTYENLKSLRLASFCGEPLMPQAIEMLFEILPKLRIFNTYGPTETTVFCTFIELSKNSYENFCDSTISIGNPIAGWNIDLIGGETKMEGEIVIWGDYIGAGYWKNDAETQARYRAFIKNNQSHPAFYTGDWAEKVGENLYFRSRIDRQVKIHGHRIELGEIDYYIREFGVPNCCSVIKEDRIYSFIERTDVDKKQLREYLAEKIPQYALPYDFIDIDLLPRNQNDKIDVKQLVAML